MSIPITSERLGNPPRIDFAEADSDDARPSTFVIPPQVRLEAFQVEAAQVSPRFFLAVSQIDNVPSANPDHRCRLLDARMRVRDKDVDFDAAEAVFGNGPVWMTESRPVETRDGPVASECETEDVGGGGASRERVLCEFGRRQGEQRQEVRQGEVLDRD